MAKMKAYATFDGYLKDQVTRNRPIIRALRKFVASSEPELVESVKWSNGCWLDGKRPVAYVYSADGFVQFGFAIRGSSLKDPKGLLEGDGRYVRYIKVPKRSDIDPRAFAALLRQAATPLSQQDGKMTTKSATAATAAAKKISARIADLGGWRGEALARVRELILAADPDVEEEWKWAKASSPGVPVWSHDGIICTGESYKQAVKLTFARGASLKDPKKLFNSSLEGATRRAIDIREGDKLNEAAFKTLIRAAVAANGAARKSKR